MFLGTLPRMRTEAPPGRVEDVICFSHLRWNFVYQRPQHLLSRCARNRRVFFFEEPIFDAPEDPMLTATEDAPGVTVVVPHLTAGDDPAKIVQTLRRLLDSLIESEGIQPGVLWYYTPVAL